MSEEPNFQQLYANLYVEHQDLEIKKGVLERKYQELFEEVKMLRPLRTEKICALEESISTLFTQVEEEIKSESYGLARQKLTIDYQNILKEINYWGKGKVDISSKYGSREKELLKKLNGHITKNGR